MFWFLLACLLLVVAVGLCFVARAQRDGGYYVIGAVAAVMGLGLMAYACVVSLDAGEVGVPVFFGAVHTPLRSGIHLVLPGTDVFTLSTRTQQYTMSHVAHEGKVQGDDAIYAKSQDNAGLQIEVSVQYHIEASAAGKLYASVGLDYQDRILRQNVRSIVTNAAANYPAQDINTRERLHFEQEAQRMAQEALAPFGIVIERLNIRSIDYTDQAFKDAIAAKLSAQQAAAAQQFAKIAAEQKAQIARIEAQGIADSQRIIHSTLTREYLMYLYIKTLPEVKMGVVAPIDKGVVPLLNLSANK